jgi:hypothetical protein
LAEVENFCHLGDVLDCEAGLGRKVGARVAAAWSSWKEVSSLLVNRDIPVRSRGGVYVACIRSVILFGAESWVLTVRLVSILRSRMLRYLAEVRWQGVVGSGEVASRC